MATETLRLNRADRVHLIEEVRRLHPDWTQTQIAEATRFSPSYVNALILDPDGEKQRERRDRYGGTCVDCGAPTKSSGSSKPSPRCTTCARRNRPGTWTRESIIAAFQEFHRVTGRAPAAADLNPAQTRHSNFSDSRRQQILTHGVHLPAAGTVYTYFPDGFRSAVTAAGLEPRPLGMPHKTRITRDELIAMIKDAAYLHDTDIITARMLTDTGRVNRYDIRYHGGFAALVREAGFKTRGGWPYGKARS